MILKIIGSIFIFVSSGIGGYYFSMRDKYRILEMRHMRRALTILKGEIDFSCAPLAEAFMDAANRVDGKTEEIFEEFSKALAKKQGENIYVIWEKIIKEKGEDSYFKKEDLDTLLQFGKALGCLDRQQQLSQIDLTMTYFNETEQDLIKTSAKTAKIYRSMGILGGALLVIVLY